MKSLFHVLLLGGSWAIASVAMARASSVTIEVVDADGVAFREFPVTVRDGALRSYLQAEKGARYQLRVRNATGERLGLVIAVDGRNIINGGKSDLARTEPMYVLAPYATQDYAGWRASLEEINEFYFTDWSESYAEAFGDRSARGVIAVAVYGEAAPPRVSQSQSVGEASADAAAPPSARSAQRDASAGTGYGDRRVDRAVEVAFVARSNADSRHFIRYEWPETLCRRQLVECGEQNRFWDESRLGFAPPPPRRR